MSAAVDYIAKGIRPLTLNDKPGNTENTERTKSREHREDIFVFRSVALSVFSVVSVFPGLETYRSRD